MAANGVADAGEFISSFEHLYTVKAFNKTPVHEYVSKDTGLTVVIAEVDGPVVNGYFCLATEAFDDDGLPHTLEHLIFMASEDYPFKGVLDLLANRCLASGTNAWTDVDHTCYTMETAGYEGFLSLMPIYVDHILYPTLTDEAFLTEVHHITGCGEDAGVVYCEMQGCENSGESRLHLAMQRTIYPGECGYSSNTGGIMKNLRESTSNEKVRDYHKSFYRPENLKLIITGRIAPEDVFKALAPVEKKILSKGDRGSFQRPWQNPCPPLTESKDLVIKYPSDDESNGMVCVAWRGPSAVTDLYTLTSCSILLTYLTDLSIAPLQKEFVEIEDPYASEVSFSLYENSESCLYVLFQNVPKDKMKLVKPKFDDVLKALVVEANIDLERLESIIKRQKSRQLSKLEKSPHSAIADMLIGHMLYGNSKDDLYQRINPLENLDKMLKESKEFWVELLSKWFVNNVFVSIEAEPSCEEQETMAKEEKDRIDEQVAKLGLEGLQSNKKILENAIICNDKAPPPELLTCVPIPDIKNLQFHNIKRHDTNIGKSEHLNLMKTPVFAYADHIDTNFVYLFALVDTALIPPQQRFYLPLLLETMLESPIDRDGVLIPHEEIVVQLQNDTITAGVEIGLGGSSPLDLTCGEYAHIVILSIQVEREKLQKGIIWLKELLYDTIITKERLKVIATKMINNLPLVKRSGRRMVRHLMRAMYYTADSNQYACNIIKQQKFLTEVVQKLDSDNFVDLIKELESIRNVFVFPPNLSVYCAANLNEIGEALQTYLENDILPNELKVNSPRKGLIITPDWHLQTAARDDEASMVIVGMGCLDSSEFIQTTRSIQSYTDPLMPALLVYAQYLTQAEGPLWKRIRGKGYAYGYAISLKVHEGLLYLALSRATNVVDAYKEAFGTVVDQVNNKQWDATLLESAKSSLIYEFVKNEESIGSVIMNSLQMYFYQCDYEYNRTLLRLINDVTIEDLNIVGRRYFLPLFDRTMTKTAIVTDPAKVEDIACGFKQFEMYARMYPSLEESFLGDRQK